jgi:exodeoxyribonuclease-5
MIKTKKNKNILHVGIDQLMLPTGKIITFNDEQYEAINKIRNWLKNGQTFFTLSGHAGTGKTTCIKKIIDEYRRRIVVSAPTHKAKKVIMLTTGMDAQTLHSLLGLRPDIDLDNFNPNDPEFNQIAEPKISEFDLVIIDEASMINEDLYKIIVEKTKDTTTKVLFMGDPAQIPPVGEKESVVFTHINEFYLLTKIERQNSTNPIFSVSDVLRNNLTIPDGGFEKTTNINEIGEGIIFTSDKNEFRKSILEKYTSDEFKINTDFAKVIAWRNKTVMGANKSIRTALFGENANIIEIGDILMAYRSIRSTSSRFNIIENSTDYRVVDKSDLEENKYKLKGYRAKIREDLPHGKFKFKEIFIVDIKDHDNLHKYAELHDKYKEYGRNNKNKEVGSWTQYYDFRRHNILMTTIGRYKDGKPRSKFDIIAKDMDYGMSITCHKCQGSTYVHAFVMENDIDINWLIKERNQLKYTSFTRPTTSVTVLINK